MSLAIPDRQPIINAYLRKLIEPHLRQFQQGPIVDGYDPDFLLGADVGFSNTDVYMSSSASLRLLADCLVSKEYDGPPKRDFFIDPEHLTIEILPNMVRWCVPALYIRKVKCPQ